MGERERHSLGQTGRGRRFSQHKSHPNASEGMATGHHPVHPPKHRVGSVGETNFLIEKIVREILHLSNTGLAIPPNLKQDEVAQMCVKLAPKDAIV